MDEAQQEGRQVHGREEEQAKVASGKDSSMMDAALALVTSTIGLLVAGFSYRVHTRLLLSVAFAPEAARDHLAEPVRACFFVLHG
jgi:hypothetical protein